jgi:hypothetical protein
MKYEVFTAVKIEFMVFWVVVPCNAVVVYQLSEDHAASIFRVEVLVTQENADSAKVVNVLNCRNNKKVHRRGNQILALQPVTCYFTPQLTWIVQQYT